MTEKSPLANATWLGNGTRKTTTSLRKIYNDEPEGPVPPPRQSFTVDCCVVLFSARDVLFVPQPWAEPKGQARAAHATLRKAHMDTECQHTPNHVHIRESYKESFGALYRSRLILEAVTLQLNKPNLISGCSLSSLTASNLKQDISCGCLSSEYLRK